MADEKLVNVECTCNPDVHIGDGRVLKGPERSGTRMTKPGDVAAVTADVAKALLDNGQVSKTDREPTVFIENTAEYKVKVAEEAIASRKSDPATARILEELIAASKAAKQA